MDALCPVEPVDFTQPINSVWGMCVYAKRADALQSAISIEIGLENSLISEEILLNAVTCKSAPAASLCDRLFRLVLTN